MKIKGARPIVVLSTILAAGLLVSCAKRPVAQPEAPDLILLLPDPGNTTVGPVNVSTPKGAVDLSGAWQVTRIGPNQTPTPATTMDKAEVERMFHDVLAALPPEPRHFTLYFKFGSDELTSESHALTPQILQAVKARPYPDVIVVGHTDTTGSATSNDELGRKRALIVRNLLVAAGLDASAVEATSHGENDPLVKTADDTYEPRNRRVEVDIQ